MKRTYWRNEMIWSPIIGSRSNGYVLCLILKVGICGGFTTFSSFALETEGLLEKGSAGIAMLYVILSLVCGVLAVFAAERLIG